MTILPSGRSRTFPHGTLLADALFDMGVVLDTPCGGKGTCGKCGIKITAPASESPVQVLACRYRMHGDLSVAAQTSGPGDILPRPHVRSEHSFGVAVDIGTTTVRMSLVGTVTGESFKIASFLNPQRRFGHDVISRIAQGGIPEKHLAMRNMIRQAIGMRLKKMLNDLALPSDRIKKIVFSGNTTMLYLLFGLDVTALGRHPYTASVQDFSPCLARDIDLSVIEAARVRALPVCGAFTGGDLLGAMALCGSLGLSRHVFFIDLGTNGELFVLDGSGKPFITSCAMGPALEGMNISSGMTVYEGAVTHIHGEDGGLGYAMIGDGVPSGITGTALIDLIAILLEQGVVSTKGAFARQAMNLKLLPPLSFQHTGSGRQLRLWGEIGLMQKDIRQVQLAKAASHAAAILLLKVAGLNPEDFGHVLIAGAFGEHMDLEHFKRLGFIPDFPKAKVMFIGNASLRAAQKACMDTGFIDHAAMLRGRCREVPLSTSPEFPALFLRSLAFAQ